MKLRNYAVLLGLLFLAVPLLATDTSSGSAAGASVSTCAATPGCIASCETSVLPSCDNSPGFDACLKFYGQSATNVLYRSRCSKPKAGNCILGSDHRADLVASCKAACQTCAPGTGATVTKPVALPTVPSPNANSACFRSCGESASWTLDGGTPKPVWFNIAAGQTIKTADLHSDCSGLTFKSWSGGAFSTTTDTLVPGQAYLATSGKTCTINYNVKCA